MLSLQAADRGGNYLNMGESKVFEARPQRAIRGPWRLVLGPEEALPWIEVVDLRIGQDCPFLSPGGLSASLFSVAQLAAPELKLHSGSLCVGGTVALTLRNIGINMVAVHATLAGSQIEELRPPPAQVGDDGCSYHGHFVYGCSRCSARRRKRREVADLQLNNSYFGGDDLDAVFGYDDPMSSGPFKYQDDYEPARPPRMRDQQAQNHLGPLYPPYKPPPPENLPPGSSYVPPGYVPNLPPGSSYVPPGYVPHAGFEKCCAEHPESHGRCVREKGHADAHVSVNPAAQWLPPERCGQSHPIHASPCLRNRVHAGDHVDGLDRSWRDLRPICGNVHPDQPWLVCDREVDHRHAHENDQQSWPRQLPTPSREQLKRAETDRERYIDDGWNAWESPTDES